MRRALDAARDAFAGVMRLKEWFDATAAGRALARYNTFHGGLLAGGIAYASLTSLAAGLLLALSVASLIVVGRDDLREAVVAVVSEAVPGLFPVDGNPGLVDPESLKPTAVTGVVGVVALVMLARTAMGYLSSLRSAVRTMLGGGGGNAVAGRVADVATLVALGLVVVLGAAIQVAASSFAVTVAGWLEEGATAVWTVRVPAVVAGFVVDVAFVMLVYVVLGRVRMHARVLLLTIAAVALVITVLQQLSSMLVASASGNVILAPFAAVLVVMLFASFVAQVLLLGAAWLGAVARGGVRRSGVGARGHSRLVASAGPAPAGPAPARPRRRGPITTWRATERVRG